jgi:subfamily B ATP-binding cassette protein MsbA
MKSFRIVLNYARGFGWYSFLNIVFNILSAIFNLVTLLLFIPFLKLIFRDENAEIIAPVKPVLDTSDGVLNGYKSYIASYSDYAMNDYLFSAGKTNGLLYFCLFILALFFLKNLTRYLAMYYLAIIRNGVVMNLRKQLYEKLISLPVGYFTNERKGDLISRLTNDVTEIEVSVMSSLELIFREPFTITIFLISMVVISPGLTLFSLILMPVSALIISRVGRSLKRTSAKGQAKMGEVVSAIDEMIGGLRILKAFNAEDQSKNSFDKVNSEYNKISIRMFRKRDLSGPMSEFLGSAVMITLVWFGGKLIIGGDTNDLSGESFIGFVIVFSQLIRPVQGIATAHSNINKGLAAKDRVDEVLHTHNAILEQKDALPVTDFKSEIKFENVTFRYETENVLKNITFSIPKGKTIALVGQSGSGKSTIADLVPRFYDTTDGDVLLDGISLKKLKAKDIRALLGIVSQESILFNDTVAANIALGDSKPDLKRVEEAAKIANAHEFISNLENGYHQNIGERGMKLSGGQRQRLCIARAVYKNPPVLILDEATSALDTESEKLVQDSLNQLMKNRTTLVIAHRLSTIQHADEIIVLQKGEIAERGNHADLYAANGVYRKLCDMQSFV